MLSSKNRKGILQIGGDSGSELEEEMLRRRGFRIDEDAGVAISSVLAPSQTGPFGFVVKSLADVGLPTGGSIWDILDIAPKVGLSEFTPHAAFWLRMALVGQKYDEYIRAAMQPIQTPEGGRIFRVYHHDGADRFGVNKTPDDRTKKGHRWGKTTLWAFATNESH